MSFLLQLLMINLSIISWPLSDPAVQMNHCSLLRHFPPLPHIVHIMVFSPLGVKSHRSSLGLETIKFTSLLTYTSPLTSAAPTHEAATCASHCERTRWPPFYPQPASAGSCGDPELIYGPVYWSQVSQMLCKRWRMTMGWHKCFFPDWWQELVS